MIPLPDLDEIQQEDDELIEMIGILIMMFLAER